MLVMKLFTLEGQLIKEVPWNYDISNFTGILENHLKTKLWYKNGEVHREDGPAIEYCLEYFNESKEYYSEDSYYINGKEIENIPDDQAFKLYIDLLKLKGLMR